MVKANNSGMKIVKIAFYKSKTMIMKSDLENPHQRENLMFLLNFTEIFDVLCSIIVFYSFFFILTVLTG